jgi:hypothetical protein
LGGLLFFAYSNRNLTERSLRACRIFSRTKRETTEDPGKSYMKEAGDILKIVGMVLLVLFVLAVGVPLVLAAAGVALGIIGMLVGLAIALIKIAIVVAIIYLIIVGIRALLR